jgi:DNA end-binding protein Ku
MARSVWTGSISFGLVTIPIRVFPAVREHDVHFHQLAPDGSRVQYKRVSSKTGREVAYDDIRKGFETSKGRYVAFEPDELDAMAPPATKTIDIEDFVPLEDIDPIYFERTYHLSAAGDGASKAYALLAAVMDERERVGIGRIVLRDHQHLAAVRPYAKGLALSTMRYADEVVSQSDVPDAPGRRPSLPPREKKLAAQIVDTLARDWDPKRYHDDYEDRLREVIEAKKKGKTIEAEPPPASAEVIDLMEALQASLERPRSASRRSRGASRATSRATKKTTKRTAKQRTGRSRRSA